MLRVLLICVSFAVVGCDCGRHYLPDGGEADAGQLQPDSGADAGDAGPAPSFALVVTQSPGGPTNANPSTWGGVLQYALPQIAEPLVPLSGIDAGSLHDPVAVLYLSQRHELLVANRHGNNTADGTPGSISRFIYSSTTRTFAPNGTITGNSLLGVHQLAVSPIDQELFAANVFDGVSRFVFEADGGVSAHGTIANGPIRGVLVSKDGQRVSVTTAGAVIRQFAIDGGAELPSLTLPSSPVLHYFARFQDTVYVGGFSNNLVYRLREAADGTLSFVDTFSASEPVAVALDSSGQSLWSVGHRDTDVIERFRLDGGTWERVFTYSTGSSLGGIELLP